MTVNGENRRKNIRPDRLILCIVFLAALIPALFSVRVGAAVVDGQLKYGEQDCGCLPDSEFEVSCSTYILDGGTLAVATTTVQHTDRNLFLSEAMVQSTAWQQQDLNSSSYVSVTVYSNKYSKGYSSCQVRFDVSEEQRILFVETEHTWVASCCTQTGMKSHKVYTSAGDRTVAGD
ncbi:MAG: hypothetical protein IJY86_02145 [Clostridia bacterium]|nr:hypothetical protein [Clostridia bacterium]